MKRRVIQLAGKTLLLSIPKQWAVRRNIRKGDELEISEQGQDILISSPNKPLEKKISIDISGHNERSINWILSAVHKGGYDEIELFYDRKSSIETIREALKSLFLGFIITEQDNSRCVLKSISTDRQEEFDLALRRNFQITLQIADSFAEAIEVGDRDALKGILALEETNNQLSNLCERLLNKYEYPGGKGHILYLITSNLEKICDDYKYLCKALLPLKKLSKGKGIMKDVARLIREYYGLFYKFQIGKLVELTEERESLIAQSRKLVASGGKDAEIGAFSLGLAIRVSELSPSLVALNTLFTPGNLPAGDDIIH